MKDTKSNTNKFTKNDIIFHYSRQEFPTHLINKDTNSISEIIYSNESQDPESQTNKKKIKFGNCFIMEDELEPRKGGYKSKKPYQNQNHHYHFHHKYAQFELPVQI